VEVKLEEGGDAADLMQDIQQFVENGQCEGRVKKRGPPPARGI